MSPLLRGVAASTELSGEIRGENMEPSTAELTEEQQAVPAAHSVALTKTYGVGQATVHALAGITVTFERGRFTAVMGPSGSGKSTLMHCMAGLDRPTSGQTFVGGLDIGTLDDAGLTRLRRDRVGFVFQSFHLLPALNAEENVMLPLELDGRDDARERAQAALDPEGLRFLTVVARAMQLEPAPPARRRP